MLCVMLSFKAWYGELYLQLNPLLLCLSSVALHCVHCASSVCISERHGCTFTYALLQSYGSEPDAACSACHHASCHTSSVCVCLYVFVVLELFDPGMSKAIIADGPGKQIADFAHLHPADWFIAFKPELMTDHLPYQQRLQMRQDQQQQNQGQQDPDQQDQQEAAVAAEAGV